MFDAAYFHDAFYATSLRRVTPPWRRAVREVTYMAA
jgi:hypothetical protein